MQRSEARPVAAAFDGFTSTGTFFVLSLTGVWISFPQWFAGLEAQSPAPRSAGPGRAAPLDLPLSAVQPALARAEAIAEGTATSIAWPTDKTPQWTVAVEGPGGPADVSVAADGLAATVTPHQDVSETVARLMRRIHDGNDTPLIWQLIVFLGGVLPAALAVTGIIMWWRARKWRGEVKARQT